MNKKFVFNESLTGFILPSSILRSGTLDRNLGNVLFSNLHLLNLYLSRLSKYLYLALLGSTKQILRQEGTRLDKLFN